MSDGFSKVEGEQKDRAQQLLTPESISAGPALQNNT